MECLSAYFNTWQGRQANLKCQLNIAFLFIHRRASFLDLRRHVEKALSLTCSRTAALAYCRESISPSPPPPPSCRPEEEEESLDPLQARRRPATDPSRAPTIGEILFGMLSNGHSLTEPYLHVSERTCLLPAFPHGCILCYPHHACPITSFFPPLTSRSPLTQPWNTAFCISYFSQCCVILYDFFTLALHHFTGRITENTAERNQGLAGI